MPDLVHSLQGQDLGHLRIVAGLWGVRLQSTDRVAAIDELAAAIRRDRLPAEVIAALAPEAQAALLALARAGGRIPWAAFIRQFGDVREIGAGKRDREKPYLKPASVGEALFYRAFLARAFFDTDAGPQEFAYTPDEWIPVILQRPVTQSQGPVQTLGRPATPAERARPLPASDRILDDATTYLAAVRSGYSSKPDPFMQSLMNESGILQKNALQADKTRSFLEASRADALRMLVDAWRSSDRLNELRLIPSLVCEGNWSNKPAAARRFLLSRLEALPAGTWWSLDAFTNDVKSRYPDFQRPAGDYDSWFIKSAADGRYLRGFGAWDAVDGALIRFLVTEPLHRLGILDLASGVENPEISAFRFAERRKYPSRYPEVESGKLHLAASGSSVAPRSVPRAVRYQLARFCEWDDERPDEYRYHITPRSLSRAAEQGLKVEQLLALLVKHSDAGIPGAMTKALKRWEAKGVEVRAESQVVLRVSRPEILEELRRSKAARFLGDPLGPTTVIVKGGAIQKVAEAMAELGLLLEDRTDLSK